MSVVIAVAGVLGAQSLTGVDHDLRIIYAEYTLSATALGHVSGDLIRYRTTVLRALEAPTKQDFERITASLPGQRVRILKAIDQYAKVGKRVSWSGRSESADLQRVREGIDAYFAAASETVLLIEKLWIAASPQETAALRNTAEHHAAANAAPKLTEVSLALDQLLETVGEVAGEVQQEGTRIIHMTTAGLVLVVTLLGFLVLFGQRAAKAPVADPQSAQLQPTPAETPSFLAHATQSDIEKLSERQV